MASKLKPCPFCGGETHSNLGHLKAGVVHYWVDCISPDCMYRSAHYTDKEAAIAAHNRVCEAVKAAHEREVKGLIANLDALEKAVDRVCSRDEVAEIIAVKKEIQDDNQ